ncbi:MAG: type II toxin-antitoxin system Phd/YefM family antitoxin [Lentisphaerota bacterium]
MKILSATEVARNFSGILDSLEFNSEEIIILRNKHTVAKLIPGAPVMNALEALSDLYSTISDDEGEKWLKDISGLKKTLNKELKDPWA